MHKLLIYNVTLYSFLIISMLILSSFSYEKIILNSINKEVLITNLSTNTDSDGDGIDDINDIDDDNDGILDIEEGCVSSIPPRIAGTSLGGDLLLDNVSFSAANGASVEKSTVTNYIASQSPAGDPEPSGQTFISGYDAAGGQGSIVMNFNNPTTYQIVDEFIVRIQYYCSIANSTNSNYTANPVLILQTDLGNFSLTHVLTSAEEDSLQIQNWIPLEFRVMIPGTQMTLNSMTLKLETINGGIGSFKPASSEVFGFGIDFVGSDIVCSDFDNDGILDYLDIDSDNDGIPDNIEAQSTANYIPPTGNDSDNDGLDDAYDDNDSSSDEAQSIGIIPVNTDGTDNPDFLDLNSDNDYLLDIEENGDSQNTLSGNDVDGDGLDDNFDDNNNFWDINDDMNDPNPSNLGDVDNDVDSDGNNASPLTNDVDYRDSSEICNDRIDNDLDGFIDCVDSECQITAPTSISNN